MANSVNGHGTSNDEDSMSEEQEQNPDLTMLTQYVKDLSFESPNAPEILKSPGNNPNIQFAINVEAKKLEEDTFEVQLELSVDAKNDKGYIYKLELVYAGLFTLKDFPEEMIQPVLFIECPALIFPFIRHTIIRVTQDGGFPPLNMDPIDFARLFHENMMKQQEGDKTVN